MPFSRYCTGTTTVQTHGHLHCRVMPCLQKLELLDDFTNTGDQVYSVSYTYWNSSCGCNALTWQIVFVLRKVAGPGKMGQSMKSWQHRHENLSLDPQNPVKSQAQQPVSVTQQCGDTKTDRALGVHWLASLTPVISLMLSEKLSQKI